MSSNWMNTSHVSVQATAEKPVQLIETFTMCDACHMDA